MKNLNKTLLFTLLLCFAVISVSIYVQLQGQGVIGDGCSYLDPITIDILAFMVALFLVIEGTTKIIGHPNAALKRQFTRTMRIAIGCAILTIHIMQFMHK